MYLFTKILRYIFQSDKTRAVLVFATKTMSTPACDHRPMWINM